VHLIGKNIKVVMPELVAKFHDHYLEVAQENLAFQKYSNIEIKVPSMGRSGYVQLIAIVVKLVFNLKECQFFGMVCLETYSRVEGCILVNAKTQQITNISSSSQPYYLLINLQPALACSTSAPRT